MKENLIGVTVTNGKTAKLDVTLETMHVSPRPGTVLRLRKPLGAVKLNTDVDQTTDTHGLAVQIPVGSVIEVEGVARLSGMRNVIWEDRLYALFERDLLSNSEPELQ